MNKTTLTVLSALLATVLIGCDSDPPTAPTPAVPADDFTAWQPSMPPQPPPGIQPMRAGNGAVAFDPGRSFNDGDHVIDLSAPETDSYGFGLGIDLRVGERRQLRTQHGGQDRTAQTTWTSWDESIADFPDTPGLIRGRRTGEVFIKAQWGRYFRTLRVVVKQGATTVAGVQGFRVQVPDVRLSNGRTADKAFGIINLRTGKDAGYVDTLWFRLNDSDCGDQEHDRATIRVGPNPWLETFTGELPGNGETPHVSGVQAEVGYSYTFVIEALTALGGCGRDPGKNTGYIRIEFGSGLHLRYNKTWKIPGVGAGSAGVINIRS